MEHVSRTMDLPVSGMQMRMVSNVSNYHESQHFSVSKDQKGLAEPMPCNPGFNTLTVPNNSAGHEDMGSIPMWMSNQLGHEDAVILNNMTGQKTSLPAKRKAEMEHMSNGSVSQQALSPSKRPAHLGAGIGSPGFLQSSASQRRTGPAQPNPGSPGLQAQSALNKKMVRNESMSVKSGLQRGQPARKQTTQSGSVSKSQPESSEAIRSKMRESLAAALALASQKPDNVSKTEKDQTDHTLTHQMPVDSQASEFSSTMGGNVPHSGSGEVLPSKGLAVVSTTNDSQVLSSELPPNESNLNGGHTFQEFQYSSILPDGDVQFSDNFFVKDDLLQGNGLSWAFDCDLQMREGKEAQNAGKPQSVTEEANFHGHRGEVAILTPENLAFKIETELFRLFGGINKKYKEKGRSLLFNLKDQKNPELRERVLSGEISPERLCSMSAEELASKELSEWRMAKAEEMAQMVVLPDTEVDMWRLVKKTHKGEYQVEFERDDGIVDEVSSGNSMLTQPQSKKETETHSPPKASRKEEENVAGQEKISEDEDFSGSLIIPTDGTDLMQGMMVDELKDAAFLPPIVSLDEFMESLNSEPPFEILSADAMRKSPQSHEARPKVVSNSVASDRASNSPRDASSKKADVVKKHTSNSPRDDSSKKADVVKKHTSNSPRDDSSKKADVVKKHASNSPRDASKKADVVKKHEADITMKASGPEQKVLFSSALKVESIWEGILQLNISSSVTVCGLFQSGEKTSTKEWSTSLEIKGRVRLDAFEKFLQELPMSRTRALMILKFVLKDKSSENQLSNLSEAVESYTADERLGYGEPAPGVEVYLCPPTSRIAELLNKHMPKERPEANNSMENGLIGVVVWRRAHMSNSISPNSSSNHKHSLKKQPFSPPNRFQDSSNVNVNTPTRAPTTSVFNNVSRSKPEPKPEPEEDDDIPPGFGPVAAARAAKDEDDLPEFNFSGGLNPSVPRISSQILHHDVKMTPRPVDHVRELIQKYGQSGTNVTSRSMVDNRGLGIEPWNDDDDDDDIPEWRPQAPHQLHHPPYPAVHGHHLRPTNQHVAPLVNPQSPRGLAHPPPGGRWVQPHGHLHGARWRQH